MKTKLSIIALLGLFLLAGCSKEENDSAIIGSWKFYAFCNTDGTAEALTDYKECDKCFVITGKEGGHIEGRSGMNILTGIYTSVSETKYNVTIHAETEVSEIGEGANRFLDILPLVKSCEIRNNQLKLFYSGDEYLLFNHVN